MAADRGHPGAEVDALPTITPPAVALPEVEAQLDKIRARIQEVDGEIQMLARRWAWNCPGDWEDLAQEARCAIYQQLKQDPACPRSYLFQHAKQAILDYRKKGASVDGKLDPTYHRTKVWRLATLDAGPGAELDNNGSLYFKPHQLRPVEELALARVAGGALMGRLNGQQARYLCLRLQGYTWREADELLGLSPRKGRWVREAIKEQAMGILPVA